LYHFKKKHIAIHNKSKETKPQFSRRKSDIVLKQLSTDVLGYSYTYASSRINRADFIRQIRQELETSRFFEKFPIREGKMTSDQGVGSEIKIEIYDKLKIKKDFHDYLIDRMGKEKIDEWAQKLIDEIAKNFHSVQSRKKDSVTNLFNAGHHAEWTKYQFEQIDHQVHQEKIQKPDSLLFLSVNPRSFSAKNDYFESHKVGSTFLKHMGKVLIDFRHQIQEKYKIPYEDIAVHRMGGPNLIVSIRLNPKLSEELSFKNLGELLKQSFDKHQYQSKWKWKMAAVMNFTYQSALEIVRSLRKHGGEVDLADITHYKKDDVNREKPIKGVPVNVGYFHYDYSKMPMTGKELEQSIRESLSILNHLNPRSIIDIQRFYLKRMSINDPEEYQKFYEKSKNKNLLAYIERQERQSKVEKILSRRKSKDVELITNLMNSTSGIWSYSELKEIFLEDFKIIIENKLKNAKVSIVSKIEMEKTFATNISEYRPFYYGKNNLFIPILDGHAKIFFLFKIKTKSVIALSKIISLIKASYRYDYVLRNFEKQLMLDTLTGLPNPGAYHIDAQEKIRLKEEFGLATFDFNSFGSFSNNFGETAGDLVLKESLKLLSSVIKSNEKARIYRYGGEEFTLIGKDKHQVTQLTLKMAMKMKDFKEKYSTHFQYDISLNEILNKVKNFHENVENEVNLKFIKESYLKLVERQLDEKKKLDKDKRYKINLLKMPRWAFKKGRFETGLSKSTGIIQVFKNTRFNSEDSVNKADDYANQAKRIYDNKKSSPSVIFTEEGQVQWQ